MSFLTPIWWWAMAGLLVPLAIHLLSRGRRQRISIGSVRHLDGSESRALRRLRLSGWRQLLLRSLLLAALALALAGPRGLWIGNGRQDSSWVFVDPELTLQVGEPRAGDREFWQQMKSAKEAAGSVRLLAPGLSEGNAVSAIDRASDAWSLLREADAIAPAGTEFKIFTLDRVGWLRGRRPAFSRPVDWWVLPESQPNRWIQRSVVAAAEEWVVTVGDSGPQGTEFSTYRWLASEGPPEESALEVETETGTLRLSFVDRRPDDNGVRLPTPAAPIRVAISQSSDRVDDAWHLRRAMAAVGEHLGRQVVWVEPGASGADLELRLGDNVATRQSRAVILGDGEPSFEPCQGWVFTGSVALDPWLRLQRCSVGWEIEGGAPVWVDSWGRPFLNRFPGTRSTVLALQGRFDSRWSDLVSSSVLPHLLLELVAPRVAETGGATTSQSDRRATTGLQRVPERVESAGVAPVSRGRLPETLAWLLVGFLLVVERWYSGRVQ
jgi:hypothetical protein